MEVLKVWFEENADFLILGVGVVSVVAGFLVSFSKKAWQKLEKKADETQLAKITTIKAWVSQILGAVVVAVFLKMVGEAYPVAGGKGCLPIWFTCDYLLQYVVSCYGVNGIKAYAEKKASEPKKAKPVYAKFQVDENGNPIVG